MSVMMRVGLAILFGLPMVLLIATMWGARPKLGPRHDVAYAEAVFGGVVPYYDVLTSRRYVYLGNPTRLSCDFVVVRMAPDPSLQPPRPDFARPDAAQFGGLWQPSPGINSLTARASPLDHCQTVMFPGVADDLRAALELPDSWVARDPLGRTMFIYAPGARMAARIGVVM